MLRILFSVSAGGRTESHSPRGWLMRGSTWTTPGTDLKAHAPTALRQPIFRERLELILLLVVEVLCLLLFIDFLFIGYHLE